MNAFEKLAVISKEKLIINNLSNDNWGFFNFAYDLDIEYFIDYKTIKVDNEIFKNCILLEKCTTGDYSKKRFQEIFNCPIESFSEVNKNIIKKALTHFTYKNLVKSEELKNIFYKIKYDEDSFFDYFSIEESYYSEKLLLINEKFEPYLKIHLEDKLKSLQHDFLFIQKNNDLYMFNFETKTFNAISDNIDIIFNIIGLKKIKEYLYIKSPIFSENELNKIKLLELISY